MGIKRIGFVGDVLASKYAGELSKKMMGSGLYIYRVRIR